MLFAQFANITMQDHVIGLIAIIASPFDPRRQFIAPLVMFAYQDTIIIVR